MSYDILKQVGVMVSFSMKSNPITPSSYSNVKVVANADHSVASMMADVAAMVASGSPHFPDENADFTKLQYLIFKTDSDGGSLTAIPISWIEESSIVRTGKVNRVITIRNMNSELDSKIIKALRMLGIDDFTIEEK